MTTHPAELLIVDMKVSNLRSVVNAFARIGAAIRISDDADEVAKAECLVLPGVGAFSEAMKNLEAKNLISVLQQRAGQDGVPLIGICLGMQLLAESSEEHGHHKGLGLIKGAVNRLVPANDERVPNIGWCDTTPDKSGVMFPNTDAGRAFYYVHSYYMECAEPACSAAHISFGGRDVTVAVERDNVFGVQFHPEKSQDAGLDLLKRFIDHIGH